jgi:hypothetical protein
MAPRLRRLTGYLLLGVFFSTFAASLSAGHLEGKDDPLCVVPERSGSGPAAIKPKAETTAPAHCAVCHWVRAVAGAASFAPMPALLAATSERLNATISASRPRETVRSQSSPRAPPLASLL